MNIVINTDCVSEKVLKSANDICLLLYIACKANDGEYVTTVKSMSYELGLGASQVRTAIRRLSEEQLISKQTTNKSTAFQAQNEAISLSKGKRPSIKKQTNSNQIEIKSQDPSEQNEWFERLWKEYPNKTGKEPARRYFLKQIKTQDDFSKVCVALTNYIKLITIKKTEPRYILMGSTFFNERWLDYIELEVKTDAESKDDYWKKREQELLSEEAKEQRILSEKKRELGIYGNY